MGEGKYIEIENGAQLAGYIKKGQDEGKLVVIDFTATWCRPCQAIAPIFSQLSEQNLDVIFLKVDVDTCGDIASQYQITGFPTFVFIKNGQPIEEARIIGASKSALENNVRNYKNYT